MQRDNDVIAAVSGKRATIFFLSSCFLATAWILRLALNISYPIPLAVFAEARSHGPAVLLHSAYFGAILCGLVFLIFGAGTFLVDTYGFKPNALRKDVLVLLTGNAFMRSLTTGIKPSAKTASLTSLARQASRALSTIVSGVATFRSLIKRSAKLRLRHYRWLSGCELARPAVRDVSRDARSARRHRRGRSCEAGAPDTGSRRREHDELFQHRLL